MTGGLILQKMLLWKYFNIIFPRSIIIQRFFLGLRCDSLKIFPPTQNKCLSFLSSGWDHSVCSRTQYTKLLTAQNSVCSSYFHWFLNIHFIHLFSSTLLVFFVLEICWVFRLFRTWRKNWNYLLVASTPGK